MVINPAIVIDRGIRVAVCATVVFRAMEIVMDISNVSIACIKVAIVVSSVLVLVGLVLAIVDNSVLAIR